MIDRYVAECKERPLRKRHLESGKETIGQRMRFLLRLDASPHPMGSDLSLFLADLQEAAAEPSKPLEERGLGTPFRYIRPFEVPGIGEIPGESLPEQFLETAFSAFSEVVKILREYPHALMVKDSKGAVARSGRGPSSGAKVGKPYSFTGRNVNGVLFRLMSAYFNMLHNIESLESCLLEGEDSSNQRAMVNITARPYLGGGLDHDQLVETKITRALEKINKEHGLIETDQWILDKEQSKPRSPKMKPSRRVLPGTVSVSVEVADVPGMFMAIARVVSALGGDIVRAEYPVQYSAGPTLKGPSGKSIRHVRPLGPRRLYLSILFREGAEQEKRIKEDRLRYALHEVVGVKDVDFSD